MYARIVTMAMLVPVFGLRAVAAEFYVAPDGNDANAGAREQPFQTLERARDAVREHRATHGPGDEGVTVILREGRYFRHATFSLSAADSGAPGAPVVYKAADGEAVHIDGGHVLEPGIFGTVTNKAIIGRLLESARGRVLQADLRAVGIVQYGDFGPRGWGRPNIPAPMELFVDGIPQTVARWPNDDHVPLGDVLAGGQDESDQPGIFKFNTDRAARWTEAEDLYISGLFGVTWAHDTVGIAEIDLETGTFTTRHPHSYGFRQPGFPGRFTTQYYAVNLLEEIEKPGEYYIDRDACILYFLPAYPLDHSLIQVSQLATPFVRMENASHVHFMGLTFENGRDMGIVISGGKNNRIIGCTYAEGYNEGTPRWNNLEVQDDLSDLLDPDTLNFALRDNAPVLGWVAQDVHDRVHGADGENIPFEPIPFEKIGLARDDDRPELGPLPFRKLGPKAGSGDVRAGESQLWWTPSHNADRYRVRIAADAAMQNVVAEMKTQRNHIVAPDLTPGQTYFWQVEAIVDQSRSNRGARPAEEAPWPFGTNCRAHLLPSATRPS